MSTEKNGTEMELEEKQNPEPVVIPPEQEE